MLFNSFHFFIFFLLIFVLYAFSRHRVQNGILLLGSYYFYAYWDYRFLVLLFVTTTVDFSAGLILNSSSSVLRRKVYLSISILVNLSILCFFKYFNFFIDSFASLVGMIGLTFPLFTLQIILPVGISFYIFKSMSYTIDVYRRSTEPEKNFFDYALYVSFFPQLLAGPIERSSQLLAQITSPRAITIQKLQDGIFFVFWGLFLKVYVADNLARIVDPVFSAHTAQSGVSYLLAGYAYTFQIYGDFAGYSFMAKGLGTILGFEVMNNFNLPYFARNPQDFWRRWHISLSTWFRDYLYIPLGGSRGTSAGTIRNLLVTMLLCGLWHGAQITFVLWGGVHGILLAGHHLAKRLKSGAASTEKKRHSPWNYIRIFVFFHIIVLSWYLFRSESLGQVVEIIHAFAVNFTYVPAEHYPVIKQLVFFTFPLVSVEVIQYYRNDPFPLRHFPAPVRGVLYCAVFYLMVVFGVTDAQDFIYMQF